MGCSSSTLPGIDGPIQTPTKLSIEENDSVAKNYKNAHCVQFRLSERKQSIGFLCSSSNQDFMEDFGIIKNATEGEMQSYEIHLKVATAMASYDMMPIALNGRTLYTAETDCDEDNGPIYRATSTCHIAITLLNNGAFIYSNFVIENHVNSTIGVSAQDIINLWRGLKISPSLPVPSMPKLQI